MDTRTLCRALAMHALVVERAVSPDRNGTVLEADADRLAERIEAFATQAPISASEREARAAASWGIDLSNPEFFLVDGRLAKQIEEAAKALRRAINANAVA